MTTHYIDITLLPDPEFSHAHLLGALLSKLHRVLVQRYVFVAVRLCQRPTIRW